MWKVGLLPSNLDMGDSELIESHLVRLLVPLNVCRHENLYANWSMYTLIYRLPVLHADSLEVTECDDERLDFFR